MLVLGIALAGAVGAPARYFVDRAVLGRMRTGLPTGTLLINVIGSFILGVLTGLALYHAFPSTPKTILGTGFCGAFTTFSTFAYEVVRLAEQGRRGAAVRTLVAGVVLPTLAAAFGLALAAI
ncbi:MAG: fluoride exporter [Actinomycetota bacterium]|jgi:CrcB protein|nr:fluoride exporter [Actinomycetota bacterium]